MRGKVILSLLWLLVSDELVKVFKVGKLRLNNLWGFEWNEEEIISSEWQFCVKCLINARG